MGLTSRDLEILKALASAFQKLVNDAEGVQSQKADFNYNHNGNGGAVSKTKRIRRTGKELTDFRKTLASERKKGATVSDLVKKYNISPAYIYNLDKK